jgi:hypothetical protein
LTSDKEQARKRVKVYYDKIDYDLKCHSMGFWRERLIGAPISKDTTKALDLL